MAALFEDLTGASSGVAEHVVPSVVRIGRDWRGGGFVIGEGLVLTSAHHVRGAEITVTFPGGRTATGAVKGADADGDLAVVAVDTSGIQPLDWRPGARAGSVGLGQVVLVPALVPAGGPRVTWGTVSSVATGFRGPRGRLISDAFEHTAPVGRGWSGGPVVDAGRRVVGVNTHRPGETFYLARPITDAVAERVDALARGESPARRRLGISVAPPHVAHRLRAAVGLPERDGLLVREVAEDSAAASAGIQRGDLIVAVGGQPVATMEALLGAVDSAKEGEPLTVVVLRGSDEVSLEVRFG